MRLDWKKLSYFRPRLRCGFEAEDPIDFRLIKREVEMQATVAVQARCAEHKWAVVRSQEREHHTLSRSIVIATAIEQMLKHTERGVIVTIVNEFDVSF